MSTASYASPSRETPTTPSVRNRLVALAGNPNVGKTTVFNRLTGLRQKVGNYPGVTVEKKMGRLTTPAGETIEVLDLPGTYSLNPKSLDEEIAYEALAGRIEGTPLPDLVVCVLDASNLERNLYFATQVMDLGLPTVIALNMMDQAEASGMSIDTGALSRELGGVPVVPMVAARGEGLEPLKAVLAGPLPAAPRRQWALPAPVEAEIAGLMTALDGAAPGPAEAKRFSEALRALGNDLVLEAWKARQPAFHQAVEDARRRLGEQGVPYLQAEVIGRYGWLSPLVGRVVARRAEANRQTVSDRLDAVLTHRLAGPLLFLLLLAVIFQAVFTWAAPAMDLIEAGFGALGEATGRVMPEGPLGDLLVNGVIAGVGSVLVFLPQILLLFFFLGLMEDTGYMARAAFIMDRMMSRVGLSGRSVVPLLSSFACAIPGIMATRTIDNHRDRLITILVAPLMSCSARLPVYTLFIGAFIPAGAVLGIFGYKGLTLLAMYLLGTGMAVLAAWVFKRFLIRGEQALFVMELPPYRLPRMRNVLWQMVERSRLFLTRAGGIILAISIVIWFLASYPQRPVETASVPPAGFAALPQNPSPDEVVPAEAGLEYSYIGRAGRFIEPVIQPLGFDWKIGIGVLTSFAAREVIISTLATIYSVGDADETSVDLRDRLRADPSFNPLVAVSLMVFFVLACQCMSTLAIVKRETNSWRWPLFMWTYMTALAYLLSLLVYQGGLALGLG